MRPASLEAFRDCDKPCLFENLDMPAEVAIRESAQVAKLAKAQALWMIGQRRQNTEPRLLVQNRPSKAKRAWVKVLTALVKPASFSFLALAALDLLNMLSTPMLECKDATNGTIGRASCRERVCQYG